MKRLLLFLLLFLSIVAVNVLGYALAENSHTYTDCSKFGKLTDAWITCQEYGEVTLDKNGFITKDHPSDDYFSPSRITISLVKINKSILVYEDYSNTLILEFTPSDARVYKELQDILTDALWAREQYTHRTE